jgi:hypothetical protein
VRRAALGADRRRAEDDDGGLRPADRAQLGEDVVGQLLGVAGVPVHHHQRPPLIGGGDAAGEVVEGGRPHHWRLLDVDVVAEGVGRDRLGRCGLGARPAGGHQAGRRDQGEEGEGAEPAARSSGHVSPSAGRDRS